MILHRVLLLSSILGFVSVAHAQHVLPASALAAFGIVSEAEAAAAIDAEHEASQLNDEDAAVIAAEIARLEVERDDVVLEFGDKDLTLDEFIRIAQKYTRLVYTYDARRLAADQIKIVLRGTVTMPRREIPRFVQEVFLSHGLMMIRVGMADSSIVELSAVQTAQYLKQRALPFAWNDIDECTERPAEIFTCVVPLEHVECERMQRVLNNLIQEHRLSFVAPLDDANSVVICGSGRQMTLFAATIRACEKAADSERAESWRVRAEPKIAGQRPGAR